MKIEGQVFRRNFGAGLEPKFSGPKSTFLGNKAQKFSMIKSESNKEAGFAEMDTGTDDMVVVIDNN